MFPLDTAQRLQRAGMSLIPLRGSSDKAEPKAPAVGWSGFQKRAANWREIVQWVAVEHRQIGIVTGRTWGVVVVDFDDTELWERFAVEQPVLVQRAALIVQTKRGVHVYITIQRSGSPVPSYRGGGWDLKAEGGYVVAPDAEIANHQYTIIRGSIKALTSVAPEGTLDQVTHWLNRSSASGCDSFQPQAALKSDFASNDVQPQKMQIPGWREKMALTFALPGQFLARLKSSGGRNQALFETACWARDHGLTQDDSSGLLREFLRARSPHGTKETDAQRTKEFNATLKSAFSRPPRIAASQRVHLSDAARQALSRAKLMHIWRLLDALYKAGYRPGHSITRQQALVAAKGVLGQRNTWEALADTRFFGIPERRTAKGSPEPTPKSGAADPQTPQKAIENCLYSRGEKLQLNPKSGRGRPTHIYHIPSPQDVCRVLNVSGPGWSSSISHHSSREARLYLYGAKIAARPGCYSNAALTSWFGVCRKTLKSYERALKIVRTPQYEVIPVALWNVDSLPQPKIGYWLEANNKRYPTHPAIAEMLLKHNRVALVRQRPCYICPESHLKSHQRPSALHAIGNFQAQREPSQAQDDGCKQSMTNKTITQDEESFKTLITHQKGIKLNNVVRTESSKVTATVLPEAGKLNSETIYPHDAIRQLKRNWRLIRDMGRWCWSTATMMDERLALVEAVLPDAYHLMPERIHDTLKDDSPRRLLKWLRKMLGEPTYMQRDVDKLYQLMGRQMTRTKAAQLFAQYGRAKVLRCATFIAGQTGITNRAGYLITCLRADAKMQMWHQAFKNSSR